MMFEGQDVMPTSLVSVVMPIYNGVRYLRRSVESVLAQTWPHLQFIAVDDGSTDDSAILLSSFGERVTLIRQPNAGVAHARNAGIRAAHGEFIAFLDQDDWWRPEKVRRQVQCFQANPDAGLVHTAAVHFDELRREFAGGSPPEAAQLCGPCHERLLLRNAIYNSSVMVRQRVLAAVGPLDTTIPGNTVQDYELWLRVARRYPFGFVPEPLTVWRLHPAQGYWRRRTMLTEELRLLERYTGRAFQGPMRARLSQLLQELGLAHLEAREYARARSYFGRALWTHPGRRNAMLYALSLLPGGCAERLRRLRACLRRACGHRTADDLPSWAAHGEGVSPAAAERQPVYP